MEPKILSGSPYSLPPEANGAIHELRSRTREARSQLVVAMQQAQRMGLVDELARSHAYWSVHESNRMEFEGPKDLAGTVEALRSKTGRSVLDELNLQLLPRILGTDKRAYTAIGLETARVLALRYAQKDSPRGVSQVDLRQLHGVIVNGQWFAGQYRRLPAGISHSEHQPLNAADIEPALHELSEWSRQDCAPDDAILRAAVGHAWFAHVHPFQDGNGRVARLLANILLGQDRLPAAVVKAGSKRSPYIAALAHSDEGGDILPLAGLFLDALERHVSELQKPRTFQKMFNDLIRRRGSNYFDWYWGATYPEFFSRLREELTTLNLQVRVQDQMTREVFDDLRQIEVSIGREQRNVTAAIVTNVYGRELAMYLHSPSFEARSRISKDEMVPSISFAVPNPDWGLGLHRRLHPSEIGGLSNLWVQPDNPTRVYVQAGRFPLRPYSVDDGATIVAEAIRDGFKSGFSSANARFRYPLYRSTRDGLEGARS